MAFVTLEDLQGQCDVVVFPRTWEETKELWVQDRIVLVRGKVEKRGESVNVLCDTVQDYITRALAADDGDPYAGLRAAPDFADGNGHSRPIAGPRPTPVATPERSASARVADAAEDLSYGDDSNHIPDDDSPFALEEPEWLREAPAAWQGERESRETRPREGTVNGERLTDDGEQGTARAERSVGASVTDHRSPAPVHRPPLELRVTVQRTPDVDRDKRLLGWVVDLLRAKPGPDRFCIVLRKNGATVQLDFPNDTTTFTPALEQQLVRRLGVGSVEVRDR
jgi:hypothetical protein